MDTFYYYVFTDCANLSAYPYGKIATRYDSENEMELELPKRKCSGEYNLPFYEKDNMKCGQLYQTGKQLNENCCSVFVMKTENPGNFNNGICYVEVDDAMFNLAFRN